MRLKNIIARYGALSVLVLLFLLPHYASAQPSSPGWYKVIAEELFVRNHKNDKLVMGTLRKEDGDHFYLVSRKAGSNYAWGYALGKGFSRKCGWVGVKYINKEGNSDSTLVPASTQLPSPGKCGVARKIEESIFAYPLAHNQYRNRTPKGRGSGAKVIIAEGTPQYGNYVNNVGPLTYLRTLKNRSVYWRYLTRDQKFVMVGLDARRWKTKKGRGKTFAPGRWGFVECKHIKPYHNKGNDKFDEERFNDLCIPAATRP